MAGKQIIVRGDSQLDTLYKKFGTASGLFDGTGDYLEVASSNTDFDYGTGNFSIDFWFRPSDSTKTQLFYGHLDTDNDAIAIIYTSGKMYFNAMVNGAYVASYYNTHSLTNGTWYHYEFTRSGTNFYMFKDGVSLSLTATQAIGSNTMPSFGRPLKLCLVYGHMDEFRISKGVARHTSGFTVPSSAYTADSYVELLLHMDGTDESTTFTSHDLIQQDTHDCVIELMQYHSSHIADTRTTSTLVEIDNHGLVADDFIINYTRISSDIRSTVNGRACRRVKSASANTLTVYTVDSQASGDSILLYKFNDISSYVQLNSIKLSLVAECEDNFSFTMHSPTNSTSGTTLTPYVGQLVRIKFDGYAWFTGTINNITYQMLTPDSEVIFNVTATPLKYRTNKVYGLLNYAIGKSTSEIANEIALSLEGEGIEAGTIEAGIALSAAWSSDCISAGEIMNEISEQNGYQWFVDRDFKLQFVKDVIMSSPRELIEGGTFTDFRDVVVTSALDGYANAIYFVGGNDVYENPVYAIHVDKDKFDSAQLIMCGSGIWGDVTRNSNVTGCVAYSGEINTSSDNVNISGHPFIVGDHFYNKTRDIYGYVTAYVDANNITCTWVAGQTYLDEIVYYSAANTITRQTLRQKGITPKTIKFHTFDMTFLPQQRVRINLPSLNISDSYWCVESVEVSDAGCGYFNQVVTATYKNSSDFSTQRTKNSAIDYFRQF